MSRSRTLLRQLEAYGRDFEAGLAETDFDSVTGDSLLVTSSDAPKRGRGWFVAAPVTAILVVVLGGLVFLSPLGDVNPTDTTMSNVTSTTVTSAVPTTVSEVPVVPPPIPQGDVLERYEPLGPVTLTFRSGEHTDFPTSIEATPDGFVGRSPSGEVMVSSDGIDWETLDSNPPNGTIGWVGDRYWLTGQGPTVFYSSDLFTWSEIDLSAVNISGRLIWDVLAVGDKFVALADDYTLVKLDPDTNSASTLFVPWSEGTVYIYTLDEKTLFALVQDSPTSPVVQFQTEDLEFWHDQEILNLFDEDLEFEMWPPDVANGTVILDVVGDAFSVPRTFFSSDGQNWEEVYWTPNDTLFTGVFEKGFWRVGQYPNVIQVSADGRNWAEIDVGPFVLRDGQELGWEPAATRRDGSSPRFIGAGDRLFAFGTDGTGWTNYWVIEFDTD